MVQFNIEVVVDPARGVRGARAVRGELSSLESAAGRLKSALTGALAVLAGGALLTATVRTLASFSQEMSSVAAITRATGDDFRALEERAISLGETTRFTSTQAAEGMSLLARAGFEAREVFDTVDDTLNLAQAGQLDLARAADITSNALRGFRLETDDAGRVVDVLAAAANASNSSVEQMGEALKFVAPIAAGVGVEIEETSAAIAALSNAGLQATLAGTGLRRVIAELESPSNKTAKILRDFGVRTSEVQVSAVGLTTALQRLADAGVDTGAGLEIFGDRGGPAFEVLSSALPDVERMTKLLEEADGTAKRIAVTMDDNLNGALLQVQSAFEGLVLRVGQSGATGALRSFFDALSAGLRVASGNVETFINILEGLAFVLGVRLASQAIPALIAALKRLAVAIASNPIGAIATAVTLAVGALIAFRDQITLAADSTTTLGDLFSATFEVLGEIASEIGAKVAEVFAALSDVLGNTFGEIEFSIQGVLELAATVADRTLGLFQGLGNALIALFTGIGPAAADLFLSAVNGLLALFEKGLDLTRATFTTIAESSKSIGKATLEFFQGIGAALFLLVTGQTEAALGAAETATKVFGGALKTTIRDIPKTFDESIKGLSESDTIGQLENSFEGAASDLGSAVLDGFFEGLDVTLVRGVLTDITQRADAARASIEAAGDAGEGLQPPSPSGGGPSGAGPEEGAASGFNAATDAATSYAEAVEKAAFAVDNLAGQSLAGLEDGFAKIVNEISDVRGALSDLAVNAFANAEDALVQFVTTGEADFTAFVDSLIADIARLIIRLLLLKAIEAIGGGAGGAAGAAAGAVQGKAGGGPVQAGRPFLVGEEGPELFTPPGAGNIVPAGETAARLAPQAQQAPVINVSPPAVNIVNVSDPSEIPTGIESAGGEQAVMNVLRRNRRQVKTITG